MGNGRISLVSREEEKRRGLELLMRHTAGGERVDYSYTTAEGVTAVTTLTVVVEE